MLTFTITLTVAIIGKVPWYKRIKTLHAGIILQSGNMNSSSHEATLQHPIADYVALIVLNFYYPSFHPSIHQFLMNIILCNPTVVEGMEPIPGYLRDTLVEVQSHCREQTYTLKHLVSCYVNMETPIDLQIMCLDYGRKPAKHVNNMQTPYTQPGPDLKL